MSIAKALLLPLLVVSATASFALDARDRAFVRNGMSEGEVVFKIGKPDHEAFIRNLKGQPEEKTWTYFPHYRDPQTLTIITLNAGVVVNVERKVER